MPCRPLPRLLLHLAQRTLPLSGWLLPPSDAGIMWSASALFGLRSPLLLYWSLIPHAGQCVMPICCARASTCFLNCLCSLVLVLLTVFPLLFFSVLVCVRWWRVAASARRAPPPSNTTLLFSPVLSSLSSLFLFFLFCGMAVVCSARAALRART